MEISKSCLKCITQSKENSYEPTCSECRIVFRVYNKETSNSTKTNYLDSNGNFEFPKQSVFFYTNNNLVEKSSIEIKNNSVFADKNVLILGCSTIRRLPVLTEMKRLGFKRFIGLLNQKTWAHDIFDGLIIAEHEDISKKEETLTIIKDYMNSNKINFDGILTFSCDSSLMVSYLSECLSLPGIPFGIASSIKNKHNFRTLCSELSIYAPNFFIIESDDRKEYLKKLSEIKDANLLYVNSKMNGKICKFPVIVKNPLGVLKDFVRKCSNVNELHDVINESLNSKAKMNLLIEEFYEGLEIDLDVLIQNNQAKFLSITDNFPPKEPWFMEQGCITPSNILTQTEMNGIKKLVSEWISKLNIKHGCLHFEAKCRPQALYNKLNFDDNLNLLNEEFIMPIEMNLRLGGASTWSAIKTSFGYDYIPACFKICLGIQLDESEISRKENAILRTIAIDWTPFLNAKIEKIFMNLDKLKTIEHLVELVIIKTPGDRIDMQTCIGWITAKDKLDASTEEMNAKIDEILKCVDIEYI